MCLTYEARVKDLDWLEKLLHQLEAPEQRDLVPSRANEYEFISPNTTYFPARSG